MYNEVEINGYGARYYIDELQAKLNKKLWTSNNYHAFGQIEIVEGLPKRWNGNEYIDVLPDDSYDATSFFHVQNDMEITAPVFGVTVDIIFQVDTSKFSGLIKTRGKYQLIYDVIDLLNASPFFPVNMIDGVQTFDNFEYESMADQMAPYFNFKIVTNLFANLKN